MLCCSLCGVGRPLPVRSSSRAETCQRGLFVCRSYLLSRKVLSSGGLCSPGGLGGGAGSGVSGAPAWAGARGGGVRAPGCPPRGLHGGGGAFRGGLGGRGCGDRWAATLAELERVGW